LKGIHLKKAHITDVRKIHNLINLYAQKNLLLPRSLSEIYDHLRDFWICKEKETDELVGTCALGICWEDLAEVRSLAVFERYQRKGIGTRLVKKCIEEAEELGIKRIFTLTYIPDYFERFGFRRTTKSMLPHKVWADCIKCSKFPDCDEIAMILKL